MPLKEESKQNSGFLLTYYVQNIQIYFSLISYLLWLSHGKLSVSFKIWNIYVSSLWMYWDLFKVSCVGY